MYLPKHFSQDDPKQLHALIAAAPLGTWIESGGDETLVNHIPFMRVDGVGPHGTLVGHVARQNPVWRALSGRRCIVVFHGPQAYVSPNWYPSKRTHHKVVPTWNYVAVHAQGVASAIEERVRLLDIVTRLTAIHESASVEPWRVGDAPADYIDSMLGAIVGIEIPIDSLVGKWKMSQNRALDDRAGVAAGLRANGTADAIAGAIAGLIDPQAPSGPVLAEPTSASAATPAPASKRQVDAS